MTSKILAGTTALGLALSVATTASAAPLISDAFTRVGPSEILSVPFTAPRFDTDFSYSGFVEILVSGTGQSLGAQINDAFYGVPSGVPYNPVFYQLNIGWIGADLEAFVGEPRNANNFIVFIEGVGSVTPPATPAYDDGHEYHFVVKIPDAVPSGQLQFGVSDGNFADNDGGFRIQVFQLAARDVPAPPTLVLSLAALAGLAIMRRRA